jgi:hypothetical protein
MNKFNPGDKIQYNHAFLRNTGSDYDIANMKGNITGSKILGGKTFVYVLWNDEDQPKLVNPSNLCHIGRDSTE